MREKNKLKKIVSKRLLPLKDDISKELESEYPEMFEDMREKEARAKKRKKTLFASLAAVAACVAVVVPCAVILPKLDGGGAMYAPGGGYAPGDSDDSGDSNGAGGAVSPVPNDYISAISETTVKEYNEENGTNILYFDFYETADSVETKLYIHKRTGQTLCMEEKYAGGFGGYTVTLMTEETSGGVGIVGTLFDNCTNTETLESCELKWSVQGGDCYGLFEYGGRRYGVKLDGATDEEKLFELVQLIF